MSRFDKKAHAPDHPGDRGGQGPGRKFSLHAQIEEVQYELDQREKVYRGIAMRNPGKRAGLDYHTARMEAVRQTLEWLRDNEDDVRAFVAQRQSERGDT